MKKKRNGAFKQKRKTIKSPQRNREEISEKDASNKWKEIKKNR